MYSVFYHSAVLLVFGKSQVACKEPYIRRARHLVFKHVIAYNNGYAHTAAVGVQLKIIGVIHYPFIFIPVGLFDFKHCTFPS